MNTPEENLMLRIYVSSTDAVRHVPVHEAVAYAARRYGMAGCTRVQGTDGGRAAYAPDEPHILGNCREGARHH